MSLSLEQKQAVVTEIAAQLGISESTAKFHLKNILEKLHAESRAELAARAVREGLIPDQR